MPQTQVREDGRITLSLVNVVDAAGITPPVLARRREELLQTGDYTPLVREYLQELFAARGYAPAGSCAPSPDASSRARRAA